MLNLPLTLLAGAALLGGPGDLRRRCTTLTLNTPAHGRPAARQRRRPARASIERVPESRRRLAATRRSWCPVLP